MIWLEENSGCKLEPVFSRTPPVSFWPLRLWLKPLYGGIEEIAERLDTNTSSSCSDIWRWPALPPKAPSTAKITGRMGGGSARRAPANSPPRLYLRSAPGWPICEEQE